MMMRGHALIVLPVFVAARTYAETGDHVVDEFSEFLGRALKGVPSVDRANLDGTTLGKTGQILTASPSRPALAHTARPPSSPLGSALRVPPLRQSGSSMRYAAAAATRGGPQVVYAAEIDAKTVKALRDATGAGMMECKKALKENDGDIEKATDYLRKKGIAAAEKRSGRGTAEGIVEAYIHAGAKLGVMVEVNCETDFVAKNPEFKELARSVAMQIAASPTVEAVTEEGVDPVFIAKEKEILMGAEDMKGKPADIVEKMVSGRIAKILKEKTLMTQPYIKDPAMTVDDLVKSYSSKFGENIKVGRFSRFNVGG